MIDAVDVGVEDEAVGEFRLEKLGGSLVGLFADVVRVAVDPDWVEEETRGRLEIYDLFEDKPLYSQPVVEAEVFEVLDDLLELWVSVSGLHDFSQV